MQIKAVDIYNLMLKENIPNLLNASKQKFKNNKRYLIYSPVPWVAGNIERLLAMALEARGCEVDNMICFGDFPACGMEHYNHKRPSCENCVRKAHNWLAAWNQKPHYINNYFPKNYREIIEKYISEFDFERYINIDYFEMITWTYKGLPIGRRVYEKIYWYFSADLRNKLEIIEQMKKLTASYLMLALATENIIKTEKYDAIIVCNGKTIESGSMLDVANKCKMPIITWEEQMEFDSYYPAHDYFQSNLWNLVFKDKKLLPAEERIVDEFVDLQRSGARDSIQYYNSPIEDKKTIFKVLNLRKDSYKIVLLCNLQRETHTIGVHRDFLSMDDWICYCIDYAIENPDVEVIIRVHPVEKRDQNC